MKLYKEALRSFFSGYVSALRRRRGLTQEEMAERLRITGRAYSDLERGIYCFPRSRWCSFCSCWRSTSSKSCSRPCGRRSRKLKTERWRNAPWTLGKYTGFCAGSV